MTQFEQIFPRIPKLEKESIKTPYTDLIKWFNDHQLELNYNDSDEDFKAKLSEVKPLDVLIDENTSGLDAEDRNFCKELILWALAANKKLDKTQNQNKYTFDSTGIGKYLNR